MHGAGHNIACQLNDCGRFITDKAGRCAGAEQCEQLWAHLKVGTQAPAPCWVGHTRLCHGNNFTKVVMIAPSRLLCQSYGTCHQIGGRNLRLASLPIWLI
jgi:hypothetical protein